MAGSLVAQLFLIRIVGPGADTDNFIAAQTIPMIFTAIALSAFQSVWLNRLSLVSKKSKKRVFELGVAQGQAILFGGFVFILLVISLSYWIPLIFSNLGGDQLRLIEYYSYILLFAAYLNVLSGVLSIALRSESRFLAAEFLGLFGVILTIIGIVFIVPIWGVVAAVWIIFARAIIQYLIQMQFAGWPPIYLSKALRFNKSWQLMKPVFFASTLYKTTPLIDRYLAAHGDAGTLTVLSFVFTAVSSIISIIERSVCAPISPKLSKYAKSSDFEAFKYTCLKTIKLIFSLVIIICFALFIFKGYLLILLTKVLHFDPQVALNIWGMFLLLMTYIMASSIGSIGVAAFYSLGDTKTPVKIGLRGFFVSIPIKFLGFFVYSITGLIFATCLYYVINTFAMLFTLNKVLKFKNSQKII